MHTELIREPNCHNEIHNCHCIDFNLKIIWGGGGGGVKKIYRKKKNFFFFVLLKILQKFG